MVPRQIGWYYSLSNDGVQCKLLFFENVNGSKVFSCLHPWVLSLIHWVFDGNVIVLVIIVPLYCHKSVETKAELFQDDRAYNDMK